MIKNNHEVYVQSTAGDNSGFLDEAYVEAGATILKTIEEVYEPFLIKEGYLMRTPRGRIVTDKSYQHLNIKRKSGGQEGLF